MNGEVLIYCETINGKPIDVAFEMLTKGRELSLQLGSSVSVVIFDDFLGDYDLLAKYGADKIYVIKMTENNYCDDRICAEAIAKLSMQINPSIMLIGGTVRGRAIAPWIASKLNTGLTADCTDLRINCETNRLIQIRPAFSGNILAEIICENFTPQIATVRPKIFEAKPSTIKKYDISKSYYIPKNSALKVLSHENINENYNLGQAQIVFIGGKGIGKEGFDLLAKLTKIVGNDASIAATRAAVDAGWVDYKYQVGQTGVIIKPRLCFSFGVSGAAEHIVGINKADTIVAINTDPNALIFKYSNYKIVGDANLYIKEIIKKLGGNKI